ncbi:hypothetical protein Tco_0995927, partial [Tanacetum coccineum]
LEKGRYGVSKVFDTAYWGFLGVGTTFDIFQNILFPYGLNTAYWSFLDTAYWILFPSWSLVKCRHRYAVSSLMDTAYWLSEQKLLKTLSLEELRSPEFNLFSDLEEYSKEEVAETMAETMEQYMSKTRADYGSGITRPKIDDKDSLELKGQFLKELHDNTFSGLDLEDANEHIKKVFEIVNLFHIPNITQDQVMLRAFLMSLTRAVSRWLRKKPSGSIITWEDLKTKFLSKYFPPACTAKKMEEINNYQQVSDETLYQAWEQFKELLMKFPQHYLIEMQEHNGTSRTRSTETSDGLAAIQAQLNNLGREIKKVNEKVYVAQVGCEQCKGPYYTKDCPLKEEAKRHEENSNMIKEIRASTDAVVRNQGALIKTLEIQIGQISKVLQERGFGSLPSSTKANPRDHVKSISTTAKADSNPIRCIGSP